MSPNFNNQTENLSLQRRFLKIVNGGVVGSCIASSIEDACVILRQEHYSRINGDSAICMSNPGESIEIHAESTAFDWAWREGRSAYDNGESEDANPYAPGTRQCECWSDGWTDGFEDEVQTQNAVH